MASWKPMYDDDGQSGTPDEKIDSSVAMALNTFQEAVLLLTNLKDHRRLTALQTCTNEVYRRADECLSQGKRMKIEDAKDD